MKHEPTAETRKLVRTFSSYGVTQKRLASYLKINQDTLAKHYRAELDDGMTEKLAYAGKSLFDAIVKGNIVATMFFLKTQGGWHETEQFNVQVTNDVSVRIESARGVLLEKLVGRQIEVIAAPDDGMVEEERVEERGADGRPEI